MALPDQLADLERKVSARFSEALAEIRLEMRRAVQTEAQRASAAMLSGLETISLPGAQPLLAEEDLLALTREAGGDARRALARALRTAFVAFDRARTQNSVLDALLASALPFGDRAALWLTRPTEIVGWGSRGFAGDPVAGRSLALDAARALTRLAAGKSCVLLAATEAAELASVLEVAAPARAFFVPLVLRDRIAAALYIDSATAGEFEVEALQMLTLAAAQRLELQALATRAHTPTLFLDQDAPAGEPGLALWDPAAVVAGVAGGAAVVGDVAAAAEAAAPSAAPGSAWTASPEAPAGGAEVAAFDEVAPAEEEPATLVESMPTLAAVATVAAADTMAAESDLELPASAPEGAAAEISWQLEEADEAALLGSAPVAEAAILPELPAPEAPAWLTSTPTHEIPLVPAAPEPEAAESLLAADTEWREVEETTAPHATLSPAATQRFSVPAVTHEIPQPEAASTIAFVPAATASQMDADLAEDATVRIERSSLQPPLAQTAPIAPPAPAPPPPPAAVVHDDEPTVSRGPRTTEVAPPADLQGPGWAFSSTRAPRGSGDNALHEEARRLARLLVSEIKLYNEDQVEEGRHNRDIYLRLKDDIDRSRQIYEERVHESVRGTTDYFQQELIRSLAGGDPRALGI